jgi:enamine deaminase RidA (YjgF/YER057c/UK114 family)
MLSERLPETTNFIGGEAMKDRHAKNPKQGRASVKHAAINPWTWQDQFGFSQAIEVSAAQRILYCAGQTSVDAEGKVLHAGDLGAQFRAALDNLETVLKKAGLTLRNIVRLNVYTTDVDGVVEQWNSVMGRVNEAGGQYASTLLGVARLAFPDLLVELEATAVA